MFSDVIVPNCVWRVGRVAAAMRLQGITCLDALFSNSLVTVDVLHDVYLSVLPILSSNFDEENPQLRVSALHTLRLLALQLDPVREPIEQDFLTEFHRELLKRLDDSNEAVRVEAIRGFGVLLTRVFPPAHIYDCTNAHFAYIIQTFAIYLDDADASMREHVRAFLHAVAGYQVETFIREMETVSKRQSTKKECEELLAYAKTLPKRQLFSMNSRSERLG